MLNKFEQGCGGIDQTDQNPIPSIDGLRSCWEGSGLTEQVCSLPSPFHSLPVADLLFQPCCISQSDWPRPQKQTHVTGTISGHRHLCMISLGSTSEERGQGQPAPVWTMVDLCARVWPPKHFCVCTWYLFLRDGWTGRTVTDGSGRQALTPGRTSDTLVCSS